MKQTKPEAIKKKPKILKYLVVFLLSVSVAGIITLFYYVLPNAGYHDGREMLDSIEKASVNLRFSLRSWLTLPRSRRGKIIPPENNGIFEKIYIAAIDNETIENSWKYGDVLPLDRRVYARMVDHLNTLPDDKLPALIFFDVVFDTIGKDPAATADLINAFKNYRGVIGEDFILDLLRDEEFYMKGEQSMVRRKQREILEKQTLNYDSPEAVELRRFELPYYPVLTNSMMFPKVIANLPDLSRSLTFAGTANIDTENVAFAKKILVVGSYYHQVTNDKGINDKTNIVRVYYPSVVLAMVVKLLHAELSNVVLRENEITIRDATYNGEKMDFTIPVDNQFRLDINFRAGPSSGYVNIVSLMDVQKTDLPEDAVLFVGMFSPKGGDIWMSPFGPMFGIEHIAYALGTIMNRDFLTSIEDWVNILYVFILTLFIGMLVAFGIQMTILAAILSIIIPIITGQWLFQFNTIILTAIPMISAIVALVINLLYMLLTEEKEKSFIKSTFSKYVSPDLVDILIQNPEMMQLGGQAKEITVFFSGVKGFANVSAGKTPKEIIDFLNDYFSAMTDIVMDTKGTIDKYMGDVIMAFWGAPIDLKRHALKACQACIRMQEALKKFNEQQVKKGNKPIGVLMGMNTGNMIVGNVGSEKVKSYTVIGDSVNLASRIKGLTKFYHVDIVISEYVYEQVKDYVIVRELDLTRVKGKVLPVKVYELIDVTNWD